MHWTGLPGHGPRAMHRTAWDHPCANPLDVAQRLLHVPNPGQAAARYDRDASRYHQGVYKRKRADLVAVLDSTLSPLFLGQLKNLHKACLVAFKNEMLLFGPCQARPCG